MDSLTEIIAAVENKDNSYLDDYADLEEPGGFISTIDKVSSIFKVLKLLLGLKNLENRKAFFNQGKLRETHTKYWKTQGISNKYYLLFLVIYK